MGESVENKPVGTWFGPNTVLQVSLFSNTFHVAFEKKKHRMLMLENIYK